MEFFKKYQSRARRPASIRSATISAVWGYAYAQVLEQAIEGDQEPEGRRSLRPTSTRPSFKTIHGDVKFGANGEWEKSGMLQVQYHDIKQGGGSRPGAAWTPRPC